MHLNHSDPFVCNAFSIDTMARPITYASGKVPPAVLADLRAKLAALMGM